MVFDSEDVLKMFHHNFLAFKRQVLLRASLISLSKTHRCLFFPTLRPLKDRIIFTMLLRNKDLN